MGIYLNPGNGVFERIIRGKYIDKTGLIDVINARSIPLLIRGRLLNLPVLMKQRYGNCVRNTTRTLKS